MELRPISCKCNTDGNYVKICCFNPVIFFVCKLCRGAFENADKLILHKRQQHSLKDLRGTKFIIFEERFVETETDDNTFRKELTSTVTVAGLGSETAFNDINSIPPLHQDDSPADPAFVNVMDNSDESEEFKLPNPFIHLRRLTAKEINCYSRPTAATNQNQKGEDVDVNDQDERRDSTAKQNVSCDKSTTIIDPRSANSCSDSTLNGNVSTDLTESQISRIVQNFEIIHVSLSKKLKSKQLELDGRSAATVTEITEKNKKLTFASPFTITFENAHPASSNVSSLRLQAKTISGSSPEQSKISDPDIQNNCMETQTIWENQSHPVLYERSSSTELLTINKNENDHPGPEIIADGEFIVANVVQSSDGIGCVQFLSACAPVNPEKESTAKKTNLNETVEKQHPGNDTNPLETEKAFEFDNSDSFAVLPEVVSDEAGDLPSPMPVSLEVVPLLTEPAIKTGDPTAGKTSNSEVAELLVEVNTPQISVFPQTETEALVQLSIASMSSARPLRKRSRINYSETQTCAKCSRDFYTVEELETHEKVCLRNNTNLKREQLRKRGLTLMTISDGAQETHADANDTDEIQVIQTAVVSPIPIDLAEVKVTDIEGDQDYDCPEVSSSSDSEIESRAAELKISKKKAISVLTPNGAGFQRRNLNRKLQTNKVADKNRGMKGQNISRVIQHKVTKTEKLENYSDCSLSLKDWIMKEMEANPENIILLDPDPFQAEDDSTKEVQTPVFVVTLENPTKCKLCSKRLNSDLEAKRHLKSCWTKNKTKHVHCPMCSKSYVGPGGLWKHKKLKHSKQPKKTRPQNYSPCSLSLKDWIMKKKEANPENIILLDPDPFQAEAGTNKEVETPVFVVTPENPIKCKLCSMKLTSERDAKRHLEICYMKNKTKHVHCPMCYKSYVRPSGLWKHKKLKHSKQPKKILSFKCTICEKELTSKEGFKHHMEVHKHPNLKPFICEICGSGFRIISGLQRHKLYHSENRPFKCKLCSKAFKNKEVLRKHQVVHIKDTNYHCLPCNKSFKSRNLLQRHSLYHLKEKWYPCKAENCDSKFPAIISLWGHCKKYHAELFSQLAKLSCTVCNEKFMYNDQLERHMISHGGGKRYKCSKEGCNGTFTSKQSLEEHFRKHTGERPYQCETCGSTFARLVLFRIHLRQHKHPKVRVLCHLCPKTFSRNWELQQHLTFHEKGRQFKCDKCDLKFMSKSNLKGHMKTHERKGAIDDLSSSSESEVESEEGTTEESEPESEQDVKSST